jgi:hypothetical protein
LSTGTLLDNSPYSPGGPNATVSRVSIVGFSPSGTTVYRSGNRRLTKKVAVVLAEEAVADSDEDSDDEE